MNCKSKNTCQRMWGIIVVGLAIIIALLLSVAAPNIGLIKLAMVIRFFQFMLIVLGVGALIKYLFTCGSCACPCVKKECEQVDVQPKY